MHCITRKRLRQFWALHPDAQGPLSAWFKQATRAHWHSFADVRSVYPHADQVGKYAVFNIGGNKYRLIVEILYASQKVLIRHVLTHAEYDRGKWKN